MRERRTKPENWYKPWRGGFPRRLKAQPYGHDEFERLVFMPRYNKPMGAVKIAIRRILDEPDTSPIERTEGE